MADSSFDILGTISASIPIQDRSGNKQQQLYKKADEVGLH